MKYRNRPTEVEAMQFTNTASGQAIIEWCDAADHYANGWLRVQLSDEFAEYVWPSEWIIRTPDGWRVLKDGSFHQIYELIGGAQ